MKGSERAEFILIAKSAVIKCTPLINQKTSSHPSPMPRLVFLAVLLLASLALADNWSELAQFGATYQGCTMLLYFVFCETCYAPLFARDRD